MDPLRCPLCLNSSTMFYHRKKTGEDYYKCLDCNLIFLNPDKYLKPEIEHERYLTHENNVEDEGYQKYLMPIVDAVVNSQLWKAEGLDYGCGPSSVVTHLLRQRGYDIVGFDPYFLNEPKRLEKKYDYIVCTEVVEHFYKPFEEFGKLKRLLKPLGTIYIRTSLTDDVLDFEKWHYHRDPTHVCFYSTDTIRWICRNFRWEEVSLEKDCIVLRRN